MIETKLVDLENYIRNLEIRRGELDLESECLKEKSRELMTVVSDLKTILDRLVKPC